MTSVELLTFSMRSGENQPAAGSDWFRIVEAKKASDATKIYIYDEIGFWGTTAKDFAASLNEIESDEIELHLNSPGGSVFDGLAIHSALKNHSAKVTAIVDGLAASAASFILQAADERKSTRNAQIMIHDAKAYAGGNAEQMRKAADLLDRVSDNIADIYQVRSGQGTVDSWRALMKAGDEWYSGNEALDSGLVDEVLDNPEEDEDEPEEAAENSWTTDQVEAFLKTDHQKFAANANAITITNRVEEAHMTGQDPKNKKVTPPAPAQPPAAPVASQQSAESQNDSVAFPNNLANFVVKNNGEFTLDVNAVSQHILGLETFKNETIIAARKDFVATLASQNKIMANDETLTTTEEFALSLSAEQFAAWKATMDAAPATPLFAKHGVTQGDMQAPVNGNESDSVTAEIKTLEEIVQAHRDSGMSQEVLETKGSYQKLQNLKSKQSGS